MWYEEFKKIYLSDSFEKKVCTYLQILMFHQILITYNGYIWETKFREIILLTSLKNWNVLYYRYYHCVKISATARKLLSLFITSWIVKK